MNNDVIPLEILEYARYTYNYYTPFKRYSGFTETSEQIRGHGDFLDLLGSLIIFDYLGHLGKVCGIELCVGIGDKKDIEVQINGAMKSLNIKTSNYKPFHDNLNLFIKEEELEKSVDAYLQIFIHLDEDDCNGSILDPHFHIAGWCARDSTLWNNYYNKLIEIPNTGGHQGIGIPVSELGSFQSFVSLVDSKF